MYSLLGDLPPVGPADKSPHMHFEGDLSAGPAGGQIPKKAIHDALQKRKRHLNVVSLGADNMHQRCYQQQMMVKVSWNNDHG